MRAEFSSTGQLLEIACDESGSEGEKLIGGNTDVFAHAGVRLSAESAAECVREIRDRIRSPAVEYKANHLLREKNRPVLEWLLGSFFRVVDVLQRAGARGPVGEIMEMISQARSRAESFRAQPLDGQETFPALDPLIPAIVQAVVHWGEGRKPVSIVHDENNALTEERIAQLKGMFGSPHPAALRCPPRGRLADLRLVDSRSDPRVQSASCRPVTLPAPVS
ncbi:hypothetical protein FHR32_003336 [Streptosporangium album]|uniref:DUF3800 domain-containing protein n=1 Tax=Streptosporangium album TaxID=47479 RepID=A0A7W7W9L4_9ACTN|nr:NAD-dependent protein deacetylase of SIR2 family [Streptosporangium album]MBB4939031.1 hypothetical protein [Streptosporangium album]